MYYSSNVTCQQLIDAIDAGMTPCLKFVDEEDYTNYCYLQVASITSTACNFSFGCDDLSVSVNCANHSSTIGFSINVGPEIG